MGGPGDNHTKEVRKRKTSNITYMCNLKYDTNKRTYKTETNSQTKEPDLWLPREMGDCIGSLGLACASDYYIEWINNKIL